VNRLSLLESARGLVRSKTLSPAYKCTELRQVLDCASPLALCVWGHKQGVLNSAVLTKAYLLQNRPPQRPGFFLPLQNPRLA
jgi:hypothetical protein